MHDFLKGLFKLVLVLVDGLQEKPFSRYFIMRPFVLVVG